MTQDPYGQPQGSGYVVRGEVVPDDEANVTPSAEPMTRFQKVASALRGERTDPVVPSGPDPNGTWPGADQSAATTIPNAVVPEDDRPEDVGAEDSGTVRSPASVPDAAAASTAEPETVGKHAGAPAPEGSPAQEGLRPGEADGGLDDFSDLTYGSLLPDAAEFKTRWQQVQFRFVDDPAGSVTEAADVIAQVTAKLEAAIQERQRAISERQRALRDRWSEGQNTDTESLRATLLMYRAFLDQLTGPKMS